MPQASNRVTLTCLPNNAVCGNGVREAGEQCDDSNTICGDGCSDTCKIERCGDGIVSCNEQCDDGPSNGQPGVVHAIQNPPFVAIVAIASGSGSPHDRTTRPRSADPPGSGPAR